MRRWIAAAVVPATLFAGAAALAAGNPGGRAAQDAGGLYVSPAKIEVASHAGVLSTMTVTNRSTAALNVTVSPRKWTQDASGHTAAARKGGLAGITVGNGSFTLAPQASQTFNVTASSSPAYLYGAIEVVGVPTDAAQRSGVVLGYRIISSLRMLPAQKKYSLVAGQAARSGKAVVLPVTNKGNTIDPVTGSFSVKGPRGSVNDNIPATVILPGKKVNIQVGSSLRAGSYTATVTLKQGGAKLLSAKRKFSVK
jgi:hypothetical protein